MKELSHCLEHTYDDYESIWSDLVTIARKHNATVPERSSAAAWKESGQEFKGVALTGSLTFIDQPSEQVFEFRLNPLKIERTYRLARKFGSDRFFVLSVPRIDSRHLPFHLRSDVNARQAIIDWLVCSEHSFLGRKWRVFYAKPESNRKAGPKGRSSLNALRYRVYLFAESGCGSKANAQGSAEDRCMFNHLPMSRQKLIEWLMPAKANRDQRALKFFTRLAIGRLIPFLLLANC